MEPSLTNGHDDVASHSAGSVAGKKAASAKARKAAPKSTDEASRLLQARISQLEQDAAGEKDQEMEIGEWPPPSMRLAGCTVLTRAGLQSARSNEPTVT